MPDANRRALDGVSVLEIGAFEAAQYATRLLGNLGASTTKIERIGGDDLRRIGPFCRRDGELVSIPFEYLNGGKRSVAVDLESSLATDVVARAVERADLIVTSPAMVSSIAEHASGCDRGSRIVASFGPEGGTTDIPSTEFTRYNGGGSAQLVPLPGPEWRPAMAGRFTFELMSGVAVALAIVVAIWESRRRATQAPEDASSFLIVDVSHLACAAWLEKGILHRTQRNPIKVRPFTNGYSYGGNIQCADERYVCLFSLEEHHWQKFAKLIGHPEWIGDERFADGVQRVANGGLINDALKEWCSKRPASEVIRACRAADVVIGEVLMPSDLLGRRAYWDRGFFHGVPGDCGSNFEISLPTGPGCAQRPVGGAPRLGAHTREVLGELGFDEETIVFAESLGVLA